MYRRETGLEYLENRLPENKSETEFQMKETKIHHIADSTSIISMFLKSLKLVMCLNSNRFNSRKLYY